MPEIRSVSSFFRSRRDVSNCCPRPGCGVQKAQYLYACKAHWFELPEALRDKISRGVRADKVLWLEAHREALAFWRERAPSP